MATPSNGSEQTKAPTKLDAESLSQVVFTPCAGGLQFAVTIPTVKGVSLSWITKYGGVYDQKTKNYVFMLSRITDVEKALGFEPGASNLRNPNDYYPIVIIGHVKGSGSKEETLKKMKALGIEWKKQTKRFEANVSDLKNISDIIV